MRSVQKLLDDSLRVALQGTGDDYESGKPINKILVRHFYFNSVNKPI